MTSFIKRDPSLRIYLRKTRLPDIYEALFSGITVMTPTNPYEWLLEKLYHLKEIGVANIDWDMFIDESMKPRHPISGEKLNAVFGFDDSQLNALSDSGIPTPEMLAQAYTHFNSKIKKKAFSSWMQFHIYKKRKIKERHEAMQLSITNYNHHILRLIVGKWNGWTRYRKGRQAISFAILNRVYSKSLAKTIFREWQKVALDSRHTREYFEKELRRLERGEQAEDEEATVMGSGEARDDVSSLPDNVQLLIFSHFDIVDLARCACVCRSWKTFTQSSVLWNRIDFCKVKNRINDRITSRLLSRARPYVIHLNLNGCGHVGKETFLSVSECRNLQDLNLSECSSLTDDFLSIILQGCQVLLYLNLSYTQISDNSLRNIAKYAINLQYLSLAQCHRFSDNGLEYFSKANGCGKLIYLDISGCSQITLEGFKRLGEGWPTVRHWILNDMGSLTDDHIRFIAEHCKILETIELLGASDVTDESMRLIANKHLKRLKLDCNARISDHALKLIGKNCPELNHLYLVDCPKLTDVGMKMISGLRCLRVMNFADCVRITDQGIRSLIDTPVAHSICEINLTNCVRVGDLGMAVFKKFPKLTYLRTSFCDLLTDVGIETLVRDKMPPITCLDINGSHCGDTGLSSLGKMHYLRDLNISECFNVTDLGVQKFSQQARNLISMDVSFCFQLTDGGIKNLAFCCRLLSSLNVRGCRQLTDLSVQYISGVCRHLHKLDLSGCIMITEKSLKYLKKGCRKLNILSILYCKAISKSHAMKLTRGIPTVEYSCDDPPIEYGYV